MSGAPDPAEIFERTVEEGKRRLDQSLLELVATSFIAGFTIVFGIAALGIVHAAVSPAAPSFAPIAGALAFGVGLVFLIVGRAELFTENFFDPAAAAVEADGTWLVWPQLRLWLVTFVINVAGGAVLVAVLTVDGAHPSAATHALRAVAEEMAGRTSLAAFAKAITGGALVTLMSFLLSATDSDGGRIWITYVVGVLLAIGPFDHVVVTVLHLLFGALLGAPIGVWDLLTVAAVVTAGNVVGGLGLTTLSHVAQVMGAEEN